LNIMAGFSPLIGIFDSGVGGLTVLAELARILPSGRFLYFADSGHAPYGEKSGKEILERSRAVTEWLIDRGARLLLVACNTATSSAIGVLRKGCDLPVVGMEPALKPAVETAPPGTIAVLGTPFTIRERKYLGLLERYQRERKILSVPCPGLVELVERDRPGGPEIQKRLHRIIGDLPVSEISGVVLGCTHFVYLRPALRSLLGDGVRFYDGNAGTARQVMRMLQKKGLLNERAQGGDPCDLQITIDTSGEKGHVIPLCHRLLRSLMKNRGFS